ncbi:hypothetical protein [Conexibacter sp. SYSU D00693]|uniref:hypothetical protein n=1 Tax=Conexibacter sp. SYSU D00693 TaxID=2812560 RepID=UPI00196AAAB6|nr:hypothetical protein [Conexibacter sp. SYSU D00693]
MSGQRPSHGRPAQRRALAGGALAAAGLLVSLVWPQAYGYGMVAALLGAAVLARGRDLVPGAPARLAAAAAAALCAVAFGAAVVASVGLSDDDEPVAAQAGDGGDAARAAFCASGAADVLDRVTGAELRSAKDLEEATDRLLDQTEGAPPGAPCAVVALDAVADTWNLRVGERGFDDAREQLERIRDHQRVHGLVLAAF